MTYPRTFSHIGLSVPSVTEAVKFYEDVMGWYTNYDTIRRRRG